MVILNLNGGGGLNAVPTSATKHVTGEAGLSIYLSYEVEWYSTDILLPYVYFSQSTTLFSLIVN